MVGNSSVYSVYERLLTSRHGIWKEEGWTYRVQSSIMAEVNKYYTAHCEGQQNCTGKIRKKKKTPSEHTTVL